MSVIRAAAAFCIVTLALVAHLPTKHNQLTHGRRGKGSFNADKGRKIVGAKATHPHFVTVHGYKPSFGPKGHMPGKAAGQFDTEEQAEDWAGRKDSEYRRSLPDEQLHALADYKGAQFGTINNGLRGNGGDLSKLDPDLQSKIKLIDDAIENSPPIDKPVFVTRHGLPPAIKEAWRRDGIDGLESTIGHVFGDHGFSSVAIGDTGDAFGGAITDIQLNLPKGSKALYMEGLGSLVPRYDQPKKPEHEMLLPRGTKYRVRDAWFDKKPMIEVDVIVDG